MLLPLSWLLAIFVSAPPICPPVRVSHSLQFGFASRYVHRANLSSRDWDCDGTRLLGHIGENACAWDLRSGRIIAGLYGHLANILSVQFIPGGHYALTTAFDPPHDGRPHYLDTSTRLWSLANGHEIYRLNGQIAEDISADGKKLLTYSVGNLGAYNDASVWDLATGKRCLTVEMDSNASVVSSQLRFSPDSSQFVDYSLGHMVLYDCINGEAIGRHNIQSVADWFDGDCFEFYGDRDRIATSMNGAIKIWDFLTGHSVQHDPFDKLPKYHRDESGFSAERLCESTLTNRFAVEWSGPGTPSGRPEFGLYESSSGRVVARISKKTNDCRLICFSPDGRFLLVGGLPFTVYDTKTGREVVSIAKLQRPFTP